MRSDDDSHRTIHAREFLNCGDIFDVAHTRAAQLSRKHNSHQPQLAQLFDYR